MGSGKTQREFGESLGLSVSGVSSLLGTATYKSKVSKSIALAVEHLYQINHKWILTGTLPIEDPGKETVPVANHLKVTWLRNRHLREIREGKQRWTHFREHYLIEDEHPLSLGFRGITNSHYIDDAVQSVINKPKG